MSFQYKKDKSNDESGMQWTSYSDLFMSLSIIFLLMYVTASLKQGTATLQQNIENTNLKQQLADLKQQIKVYNTLKEDYMTEDASNEEQKTYEELMGKLNLLKDDAKNEKNALNKKARENEEKELALNKYQKLISNIINTNVLSKAQIKRRDKIIVKKDDIISERQTEIKSLERNVAEKKAVIEKGKTQIAAMNENLEHKVKELTAAYNSHNISKKKMEEEKERLKEENSEKVAALQKENIEAAKQLGQVSSTLQTVESQLENTKSNLEKAGEEKARLTKELESTEGKYVAQMKNLQEAHDRKQAAERAAFDNELKKTKLSSEARANREAQFKAAAENEAKELKGQLAGLSSKMSATQAELSKARAQVEARKSLARDIKANFAKNGIKADVDQSTGDVVLDFGTEYFDTGKANLKPGMRNIIEKAMPIYSESLFGNQKISKKIKAVEIIGFASPTYQGKYIDPQSLNPGDRTAVDFNLDLSFNRARSIFKYVFDTNKLNFKHQQQLLPLVKVTGRSFLAERKSERDIASPKMTQKEFCETHDCSKAQRVIIRFNLDE